MRAVRSFPNRAVIAGLALLGLTSAAAVVQGFTNGDFDEGLEGWQTRSARRAIGAALAEGEYGTEDFYQGEPMARMRAFACAEIDQQRRGTGPFAARASMTRRSAAISLVGLSQDLTDIPSTTLTFEWISTISGALRGAGALSYHARLVVERSTPPLRHEYQLLDGGTSGGSVSCGAVMVFDSRPIDRTFYADLAEVGVRPGDDIRVTVELRAGAGAIRGCDLGCVIGTLWVDRFALHPPLVVRRGGTLSASKP